MPKWYSVLNIIYGGGCGSVMFKEIKNQIDEKWILLSGNVKSFLELSCFLLILFYIKYL